MFFHQPVTTPPPFPSPAHTNPPPRLSVTADASLVTPCLMSPADRGGHPNTPLVTSEDGEENPATLAENCFRELLGRAAYGNMNNAVRPVLV